MIGFDWNPHSHSFNGNQRVMLKLKEISFASPVVVFHIPSWDPHGNGSDYSVDGFPGWLNPVSLWKARRGSVFIERLWRSLKYEAVYLHELCEGFEAERVIASWMRFYTLERPHSALGGRTPSEAYRWERAA